MTTEEGTSPPLVHRILIPATQLSLLNFINPNLRVYEISGAGSFSGTRTVQQLQFGITFTGSLTGRADLNWRADALINSQPIETFLQNIRTLTTVADAVIDSAIFFERIVIHEHGRTYNLQLQFSKGNVHPQVFKDLVVDGAIPLGETYAVLLELKRALRDMPKEFRKHWKPGYLILTDIIGNTHLMQDVHLINSIIQQSFPRCSLVSDATKNWDLRDYESIFGLRRVNPS